MHQTDVYLHRDTYDGDIGKKKKWHNGSGNTILSFQASRTRNQL